MLAVLPCKLVIAVVEISMLMLYIIGHTGTRKESAGILCNIQINLKILMYKIIL